MVVEAKRDVDRSQLAQCLEYAGWAPACDPRLSTDPEQNPGDLIRQYIDILPLEMLDFAISYSGNVRS